MRHICSPVCCLSVAGKSWVEVATNERVQLSVDTGRKCSSSYQWLCGRREAVNLLSSFCCGHSWHQWQRVSVDTWTMSPVNIRWFLMPQAPVSAQQPKAALVVPDRIAPFIHSAELTPPYSPRPWSHSYNGLSCTSLRKHVSMCARRSLCHALCVICVQWCCAVLSVSFHHALLYKLGFYGSHSGPDTNYANY